MEISQSLFSKFNIRSIQSFALQCLSARLIEYIITYYNMSVCVRANWTRIIFSTLLLSMYRKFAYVMMITTVYILCAHEYCCLRCKFCIDLIIEFYASIFHCSKQVIKSLQYVFIYVNFSLQSLALSPPSSKLLKLYTFKYQLNSVKRVLCAT